MGQKARSARKRVSLLEFTQTFNTEEKAMRFFESVRWREGRHCPHCGSVETGEASHKTMPYWCKDCRKYFSVRTGTLMQESRISYAKWLLAIYLIRTSLKGISSTKLGNDLGISQQSAWFLAHRIRQGWESNAKDLFSGQVEADEAYIGGIERNKHSKKKLKAGRGPVGKKTVVAVRERDTKRIRAVMIEGKDYSSILRVVLKNVSRGARIYTDEHVGYNALKHLGYYHESVHHRSKEYVKGQAHTNGVESFWALLKRGYYGTYHQMSAKHLQKYINEFADRANIRHMDTMDQIKVTISGLVGKRLTYQDLIR